MNDAVVQVSQRLRGTDGSQTLERQASDGLAIMAKHQQAQRACLVPQKPPGAIIIHLTNSLRTAGSITTRGQRSCSATSGKSMANQVHSGPR